MSFQRFLRSNFLLSYLSEWIKFKTRTGFVDTSRVKTLLTILPLSIKRFLSFSIDFFIISVIHKFIAVQFADFVYTRFAFLSSRQVFPMVQFSDETLGIPRLALVYSLYFFLAYFCFEGKTLGQRVMRIETRTLGHKLLSAKDAFFRSVGLLVSIPLGGIPSLWGLWRNDGATMVDRLSSTFVVDLTEISKKAQESDNVIVLPLPIHRDAEQDESDSGSNTFDRSA